MSEPPLTVNSTEAAALLGISRVTFLRHVVGLRREQGFPNFVPGLHRRYDRQAIVEWLARKRAEALVAQHVATPGAPRAKLAPDQTEAWQSLLDRRAERGAH